MSSTVTNTGAAADDAAVQSPEPIAPGPTRTCRCGHDRLHTMVSPNPAYSFLGWVAILVGISWEPEHIDFTCRRCGQSFDRMTDPAEIKKVRLFG